MTKILETNVENFDLDRFISDIKENLKDYIDPNYACVYMRPSRVEKGVYVELDEEELAEENIEGSFAEDLAKNDRILYARFILNETLASNEVKYVLGNGEILGEDHFADKENFKEIYEDDEDCEFLWKYDFGDVEYSEDIGFIIKTENGILTIEAADYEKTNFCQYIASIVNPGSFEFEMFHFVYRYKKSIEKEKIEGYDKMTNEEKMESLCNEAIELIEEFFEENKAICEDNLLLYIEASEDSREITVEEMYEEEEAFELTEIATVLRRTLRGRGPCGSFFYEGIELAKSETSYKSLGKEAYIEYMGKVCYLEERAEDILSRLEEIEEEAKKIW